MSGLRKALIIDDEPDTLRYHVEIMHKKGITTSLISSADEALVVFERFKQSASIEFDIVVIDMLMPPPDSVRSIDVRDGLTTGGFLLRRLREWNRKVPVVIVSHMSRTKLIPAVLESLAPLEEAGQRPLDLEEHLRQNWNVRVFEKSSNPPFVFSERLCEIIGGLKS